MFRGRNQDAGVTDDKRFVGKLQEVALALVVKTFSKAAAERLRLLKRQLRLTSD